MLLSQNFPPGAEGYEAAKSQRDAKKSLGYATRLSGTTREITLRWWDQ